MKFRRRINTAGFVLVGLTISCSSAKADEKNRPWLLMSGHGECVGIGSLDRKIPDFPAISDPLSLIEFLESDGYFVDSKKLPGSAGRAYAINVSDLSLNLVIVRESLCAK